MPEQTFQTQIEDINEKIEDIHTMIKDLGDSHRLHSLEIRSIRNTLGKTQQAVRLLQLEKDGEHITANKG